MLVTLFYKNLTEAGGAERLLLNQYHWLKENNFRVKVLCFSYKKDLFLNNITVGISSRGMGSVQPLGENTVEVQDDFDLVCWDFVSTPSTHGAYMKPTMMNESKTSTFTNKYSKLHELITDIICTQSGVCCIR